MRTFFSLSTAKTTGQVPVKTALSVQVSYVYRHAAGLMLTKTRLLKLHKLLTQTTCLHMDVGRKMVKKRTFVGLKGETTECHRQGLGINQLLLANTEDLG